MFGNILGNFIGNMKALSLYVDTVDTTLEDNFRSFIQEESVSSSQVIAILLRSFIEWKKLGGENFAEDMLKELTIETDEEDKFRNTFEYIENMARKLNLETMNAYSCTNMQKSVKEQYKILDSIFFQKEILHNGSLMLLITYYENLIASLLKHDFISHPERISLDAKAVTYEVLAKYNDIELVKEYLVENEVNGMMYKSHNEWIKYFTEKMKLGLSIIHKNNKDIREIIARRNILAHNSGKVNSIYLNITGSTDKEVASTLKVDREYLNYAIEIIELAAYSITIEFWLKECGKNEEEIEKIEDILYCECLEAKKWKMGKVLYGLCCENKHLADSDLLLLKINMWQCYKWLGEIDLVKADIVSLDLSAKQPRYKLAILALLDKEENFWEEYDNQNDIDEQEIKEWSLFMKIREGDIYQKRFSDKKEEISPMKEGEDDCIEKYIGVECVEN